ncbi:MAG: AsmA-like C-terminal region-containing protein [Candidatus Acidiferrales bacterium]
MRLSKRWRIALGILGGGVLAFGLVFAIGLEWASRHVRGIVMESLQDQFHGQVKLDSIEIKTFPFVQVSGTGVALHFEGREDLPPLIAVKSFTAQAGWLGLLRLPRHISRLTLEGLQITIPTGQQDSPAERAKMKKSLGRFHSVIMDEVNSENATLTILPKQAGKQPQVYDIASLVMHPAAETGAMTFRTTLRNPTPPGDIHCNGTFGPWHPDAPGLTPVSGTYTYENADLGHFKGIAGILSSEGRFDGVLQEITVDGTTDTPNFSVNSGGHPVDLSTTFHAIVDGANGDTTLQPVDAHFEKTALQAAGTIMGTRGKKGKTVSLEVNATEARIEDLLLLVLKDQPAMTGDIHLAAQFVLSPGPKEEIPDRLFLNGSFTIDKLYFTNQGINKKVDTLSMRSRGQTGIVEADDTVASEMTGKFRLQNGVITFSGLGFRVPGARIHMVGTFGLDDQALDLHGTLEMQATLSQTTTGAKLFFLKALDPLFSKAGGGTLVHFKITGTVKRPVYGLDLQWKNQDRRSKKDLSAGA